MLVVRTSEYPANPVGKLIRSEKPLGLDHLSLPVNPFRLYGVKPRAFLRQQATHDPHATAAPFDPAVVPTEPPSDLFGYMPAGVVPDEQEGFLAEGFEPFQAPRKEPRRYGRNRPPVHEPDPRFIDPWQIESVAAYGLRLGVVLGDRPLDEARGLALLAPGVQGGQGHPAPPALVLEAHRPLRIGSGELHQSVAPPFFVRRGGRGRLSTA